MSRSMADAIHAEISQVPIQHIQLIGLYNTGTPDIKATPADIAYFRAHGITVVLIDQAYNNTPSADAHAYIFDVETGAFNPSDAESIIKQCQQSRPTVYVNRSNIDATIVSAQRAPNWKGDIWLAFPGWKPGTPLPVIPVSCRYVAIQDAYLSSYDLSTVLDDSWPEVHQMNTIQYPGIPGVWAVNTLTIRPQADGSLIGIGYGPDSELYKTTLAHGATAWTPAVRV